MMGVKNWRFKYKCMKCGLSFIGLEEFRSHKFDFHMERAFR